MTARYLTFCALGLLLAGCAANPSGTPGIAAAQNGAPIGYRYYDNNHPNWVTQPSAEAIYNAQHGTYLWPPSSADWP